MQDSTFKLATNLSSRSLPTYQSLLYFRLSRNCITSAAGIASLNNVRVSYMRFEVLTVVRMPMLFFWVVTPCRLAVDTNVSEMHTVSIFRVEVALLVPICESTRCHNPEEQHRQVSASRDCSIIISACCPHRPVTSNPVVEFWQSLVWILCYTSHPPLYFIPCHK
jgi:hypothetical protein